MVQVLVRVLRGWRLRALAVGLVASGCGAESQVCTGQGDCYREPTSETREASEPKAPAELPIGDASARHDASDGGALAHPADAGSPVVEQPSPEPSSEGGSATTDTEGAGGHGGASGTAGSGGIAATAGSGGSGGSSARGTGASANGAAEDTVDGSAAGGAPGFGGAGLGGSGGDDAGSPRDGGLGGTAGSGAADAATGDDDTETPPKLEGVEIVSTERHAITLRITTSVPTTVSVGYDLHTWEKRAEDGTLSTTHVVTLDRLMSGTAHAYQITITNATGTSIADVVRSASTQAYAAEPLPEFWTSLDIGAVSAELPGEAFYDPTAHGGAFVVRGTGTDVFSDADSFHYVSLPVSGDFTFTVKVEGYYGYLHDWTKAMTMFRADMTPGSAMFNQSINYGGQDYLYYRPTTDANHATVTGSQLHPAPGAPLWARLERVGNTFTEYISTDGVSWTVNGPEAGTTVVLPAEGTAGFGVCSKSNEHLSEIVYSNIHLDP